MVETYKALQIYPGVSEPFKRAMMEEYDRIPPAVQRGLESFNDARTQIKIIPRSFQHTKDPITQEPLANSNRWRGTHLAPSSYNNLQSTRPVDYRAITDFGKPTFFVPEKLGDTPNPLVLQRRTLHHELWHRISSAVAGDNYHNDAKASQMELGSNRSISMSPSHVAAFKQDLIDAKIIDANNRLLPKTGETPKLRSYLSQFLSANSRGLLSEAALARAANETAADIYAHRYSDTTAAINGQLPQQTSDLNIFKSLTPLVAQTVDRFAGEHVTPTNLLPGEKPAVDDGKPKVVPSDKTPHVATVKPPKP